MRYLQWIRQLLVNNPVLVNGMIVVLAYIVSTKADYFTAGMVAIGLSIGLLCFVNVTR